MRKVDGRGGRRGRGTSEGRKINYARGGRFDPSTQINDPASWSIHIELFQKRLRHS